ncbi:MAG: prepilin-type N-terminal cleavage/methylation domain-containing protein [Candidatus Zixiibacteriota bacterium]
MISTGDHRGFTLIELVIVIVVLGILASVAVPKYRDVTNQAKESACRSSLSSLRQGIVLWQANNIIKTGVKTFPPRDSLATVGIVMSQTIPPNPFQDDSKAPDSIVTGVTKGVVVGTRGGWAYKASTGQIWPNTSTSVTVTGCGSPVSVGENTW